MGYSLKSFLTGPKIFSSILIHINKGEKVLLLHISILLYVVIYILLHCVIRKYGG